MIRKKSDLQRKLEIDLDGPSGNVFVLIGTAKSLAKKMHLDGDSIANDMMSGDYEHALQVFDKHFGEVVDLIRS